MPRRASEAEILIPHRAVVGLVKSRRDEFALIRVRPAVVGTSQCLGVPLFMRADQIAAMPAAIEKYANRPVVTADHNHWLRADLAPDIVAAIRHLAFVAKKNPHLAKDFIHFPLEQLGIAIDRAVDAVGPYQIHELATSCDRGLKHGGPLMG